MTHSFPTRRPSDLDPLRLPPGMEPGLETHRAYDPPPMTYSNSTHACEVQVDIETGRVVIDRYLIVEDCGTVLSPVVVEGQQHGATAMRSEEHTSELQSLMRISYAVFCFTKK